MIINRRVTLQGLASVMLSTSPLAVATSSGNSNLDDPNRLLEAFIRLAGSLDDRLIIWWMDGLRYGVVDAQAKLLFGMQVGMFHRFYRQPDGSYKVAMFELTYYTDLATGELLETFDNPYTGETNRVRHVRLGPEIRHQTTQGIARPDNPMVTVYQSRLGPPIIRGNDVWIPIDVEATIEFPKPSAPNILLNHYTTVHGKLTDALNTDLLSAPSELNCQNIIKWEPFMNMAGKPGHMMSRAAGRKLESLSDLPDNYLAMARSMHAKYIADPREILEKLVEDIGG